MLQKFLTVVGLVEPPKPKRTKHTHNLFCECRNCQPAHGNFVKMIKDKE